MSEVLLFVEEHQVRFPSVSGELSKPEAALQLQSPPFALLQAAPEAALRNGNVVNTEDEKPEDLAVQVAQHRVSMPASQLIVAAKLVLQVLTRQLKGYPLVLQQSNVIQELPQSKLILTINDREVVHPLVLHDLVARVLALPGPHHPKVDQTGVTREDDQEVVLPTDQENDITRSIVVHRAQNSALHHLGKRRISVDMTDGMGYLLILNFIFFFSQPYKSKTKTTRGTRAGKRVRAARKKVIDAFNDFKEKQPWKFTFGHELLPDNVPIIDLLYEPHKVD